MIISITHATRRGAKAVQTKESWLNKAACPRNITYTFAVDEDDAVSREAVAGHAHVVCPPGKGCNWCFNEGARNSVGNLIIVTADDLEAFDGWDNALEQRVGSIVNSFPFVIHCSDGVRRDNLITHPIINRLRFEQFGNRIYREEFKTVYGDSDFTIRTYEDVMNGKCSLISARDLTFTHRHPLAFGGQLDEQYLHQNSDYPTHEKLFVELNPNMGKPLLHHLVYA
jgi:hypothetical protein